jgi:hypothetical protein
MTNKELDEVRTALAAAPGAILNAINDLSNEQQRRHAASGEFSCVEAVCHLRDIEVEGYATRIDRLLVEEGPVLSDIDGARLAAQRDYNHQDIRQALEVFAAARAENLQKLGSLNAEQLARAGILEGVGMITVEKLIRMMCDHDFGHIEDLRRLSQSAAASAS